MDRRYFRLLLLPVLVCAVRVGGFSADRAGEGSAPRASALPGSGSALAAAGAMAEPAEVVSRVAAAKGDAPTAAPPCLSSALRTAVANPAWATQARRSPDADAGPSPSFRAPSEAPTFPSSRIAFVRDGALRIVALPSGEEHEIAPPRLRARSPAWSPDGRLLAFAGVDSTSEGSENDAPYVVYVAGANGDGLRFASAASFAFSDISFSADGKHLVFATREALVLVDLEAREDRRLPLSGVLRAGPIFSRTGARIALTMDNALEGDDQHPALELIELPSTKRSRVSFPKDEKLTSVAFMGDDVLVAGLLADDPTEESIGLAHIARVSARPPHRVRELGALISSWRGETSLAVPPRGDRYVRATRVFARVFEQVDGHDTVHEGDWMRHDLFLVGSTKPAGHWFETANEGLPQPRFDVDHATWGPDSRHLAFETTLRDFEPGSREDHVLGEGIVAVDTQTRHGAPFLVACGHEPAWGPPARD